MVLPFDGNLTRNNSFVIYIKIRTGRFLLPGWKKLQAVWHIEAIKGS